MNGGFLYKNGNLNTVRTIPFSPPSINDVKRVFFFFFLCVCACVHVCVLAHAGGFKTSFTVNQDFFFSNL